MEFNDSFFQDRFTVRAYSSKELSDSELYTLLELATHAPNTGNMQWYSMVVTRSVEGKKALSPAHFGQPQVEHARAVITFCVDLLRFEKWCRLNKANPGYDNFQSFTAALIDTSILAQQFCTIAEMHGLGTCYLGTTTYNAPMIARALKLPKRVVPVATVTVGYPAADDGKPSFRLPPQAVLHAEHYSEPSDEEISAWYAPLEAESQHYVEENDKQSLAQVFTDVRYTREAMEHFSKVFKDFLSDNDFLK